MISKRKEAYWEKKSFLFATARAHAFNSCAFLQLFCWEKNGTHISSCIAAILASNIFLNMQKKTSLKCMLRLVTKSCLLCLVSFAFVIFRDFRIPKGHLGSIGHLTPLSRVCLGFLGQMGWPLSK